MRIRIGVIGLGTVGGGLIELLRRQHGDIAGRLGLDLEIVKVCALEDSRLAELGLDGKVYTKDLKVFMATPMDILVELAGGHRFCEIISDSLAKGLKVVTANKSLLAEKGKELMGSQNGQMLFYEASCLGGIPIISSFEEGLQSNEIRYIYGIFNGTSNYILTEMSKRQISFKEALKSAQAKGYAEADPTFDVEGIDATHKLGILASLAFRTRIPSRLLSAEGIQELEPEDFDWAKSNRYAIKLIAMAERTADKGLFLGTFPAMVPTSLPLAHISGTINAIVVGGSATGDLMYTGAGAGKLPAASAVLSDVIAAAQGKTRAFSHQVFSSPDELKENRAERCFSFFVRLRTPDRLGAMAGLCSEFAAAGISLQFVHQELATGKGPARLIFITHPTRHDSLKSALLSMKDKQLISGTPKTLRILDAGMDAGRP